jgi:cytochrome b
MSDADGHGSPVADQVRVWDLPTRLFHWSLVVLVCFSVVTAKIGGAWLDWHMRSGYTILTLLIFRLLWGVAGSRYARLAHFVRGPRVVFEYIRGRHPDVKVGHNPLGALSIVAILAVLLLQASTGLFANDGIFSEGPLAKLVGSNVSDSLSSVHRYGELAVYALVGLHLAAIAYYLLVRRENLIVPMVTGDRPGVAVPPARDDASIRLRALVLFALAAALVGYVVSL